MEIGEPAIEPIISGFGGLLPPFYHRRWPNHPSKIRPLARTPLDTPMIAYGIIPLFYGKGELNMEDIRRVDVRLDAKTFRRLAFSAMMDRRSLGKEAAHLLWQMMDSTVESEVERANGDAAVAAFTRERRLNGKDSESQTDHSA